MEEDNEEEISTRHKDEEELISGMNERKKTNKTVDADASRHECELAK